MFKLTTKTFVNKMMSMFSYTVVFFLFKGKIIVTLLKWRKKEHKRIKKTMKQNPKKSNSLAPAIYILQLN